MKKRRHVVTRKSCGKISRGVNFAYRTNRPGIAVAAARAVIPTKKSGKSRIIQVRTYPNVVVRQEEVTL